MKPMRTRNLIAAVLAAVSLLAVPAARAEEPLILEMADGRFYHPDSGTLGASKDEILRRLSPIVIESAAPPAPPLRNAIERARVLLERRVAEELARNPEPDVVTRFDVWVEVTLAVWNARTDEIRLVEARKNGAGLRFDGADPGISVRRNNGVNSEFALDDGDQVVVGVRYPIFKDISVSKRKPRYELHDVVYIPYSSRLHVPEMVAWGRETLRTRIGMAYGALRAGGIRSRAFPDRLLTEVIDPELVEAVAIIEHLSEGSMLGPNSLAAMESVYIVVAGNQDDAFIHSRSSAGARGLVQFIPGTYALMAKRKELGLIQDFEKGMNDPVNAIKAQIAYLDAELAGMPLVVKDLYAVDKDRVNEYLAAAYNGGGTRVKRAIAAWGDRWSEAGVEDLAALTRLHKKVDAELAALKKTGTKAEIAAKQKEHDGIAAREIAAKKGTLRAETIGYVKKLRQMLKLLRPPPAPQA